MQAKYFVPTMLHKDAATVNTLKLFLIQTVSIMFMSIDCTLTKSEPQ